MSCGKCPVESSRKCRESTEWFMTSVRSPLPRLNGNSKLVLLLPRIIRGSKSNLDTPLRCVPGFHFILPVYRRRFCLLDFACFAQNLLQVGFALERLGVNLVNVLRSGAKPAVAIWNRIIPKDSSFSLRSSFLVLSSLICFLNVAALLLVSPYRAFAWIRKSWHISLET